MWCDSPAGGRALLKGVRIEIEKRFVMWTCRFIDRRLPGLAGRRILYSVLRNGAGERRRSLGSEKRKAINAGDDGKDRF